MQSPGKQKKPVQHHANAVPDPRPSWHVHPISVHRSHTVPFAAMKGKAAVA